MVQVGGGGLQGCILTSWLWLGSQGDGCLFGVC